jgi:uncharacterized membrane protein
LVAGWTPDLSSATGATGLLVEPWAPRLHLAMNSSGALSSASTDYGVNDKFIKDLSETLGELTPRALATR